MDNNAAFIQQFASWAQAQADIRGAFVVGSVGRQTQGPWSDVDIAFITRKPHQYRQPSQWLAPLGSVWTGVYDPNDPMLGLPTSATLFCVMAGGIYVDFSILPYRKTWLWAQLICNPYARKHLFRQQASETAYLIQDGIQVLFDRDGLIQRLADALKSTPVMMKQQPTVHDLERLQDDFYLGALHMLRYLMKSQPFAAQIVRDRAVRRCLLNAAQWQAQASGKDWNNPLNYRDRQIDRWTHPQFVEAMPVLFNGYGADNLWLSLQASMHVFRLLMENLTTKLDYAYDHSRALMIEQWINAQEAARQNGAGSL